MPLGGEIEIMTVLHNETRYGFSTRWLLVCVVVMCVSGAFMTDDIHAEQPSAVAKATFGGGCFRTEYCTNRSDTWLAHGVTYSFTPQEKKAVPNPRPITGMITLNIFTPDVRIMVISLSFAIRTINNMVEKMADIGKNMTIIAGIL